MKTTTIWMAVLLCGSIASGASHAESAATPNAQVCSDNAACCQKTPPVVPPPHRPGVSTTPGAGPQQISLFCAPAESAAPTPAPAGGDPPAPRPNPPDPPHSGPEPQAPPTVSAPKEGRSPDPLNRTSLEFWESLCAFAVAALMAIVALIMLVLAAREPDQGAWFRRHWGGFGTASTGWMISGFLIRILTGLALASIAAFLLLAVLKSHAPGG